jgi:hypothetical protein
MSDHDADGDHGHGTDHSDAHDHELGRAGLDTDDWARVRERLPGG